jgi:NAD(P)-binding Rossmann-like domain
VVIGAGHNGLTCGCYLAKAGLKVLVLEQYSEIGGMTISEEIAAPGFLSDIHASGYLVAKLTPAPQQLGLAAHGLELITPDPNWAQVFPDGKALAIGRDLEMTVKSFAQFSAKPSGLGRHHGAWAQCGNSDLRRSRPCLPGLENEIVMPANCGHPVTPDSCAWRHHISYWIARSSRAMTPKRSGTGRHEHRRQALPHHLAQRRRRNGRDH